jgi:tRNA(fMet)-specific endonuclease VapC
MSGKYLLDTNIIIAILAGEPQAKGNLVEAEQIFLPSIAIGELYYGARKSGKPDQNLQRIDRFVANNVVFGCNADTAWHYGDVKNKLRLKGRPVPENDVWIAAVAIQQDLTLVTRDKHFNEIDNLKTARW